MTIAISLLVPEDAEELLRFELENREYFEASIPPRPEGYYDIANVSESIARNLHERERGTDYMYVIRDANGSIVGRINLVGVRRGPVQAAEIGYRIGGASSGLGLATRAVELVAEQAFAVYGLHRLEAATSPRNIGSQLVLLRNGFEYYGRARSSIRLHGAWQDSLLFDRVADQS